MLQRTSLQQRRQSDRTSRNPYRPAPIQIGARGEAKSEYHCADQQERQPGAFGSNLESLFDQLHSSSPPTLCTHGDVRQQGNAGNWGRS